MIGNSWNWLGLDVNERDYEVDEIDEDEIDEDEIDEDEFDEDEFEGYIIE